MKLLLLMVLPLLLLGATREECSRMVEAFAALEQSYDAVLQAEIPSLESIRVITAFRKEGAKIYEGCKDKMSTTKWYMLGKKVKERNVNIAKFWLESVGELKNYALTHPPVKIINLCGSVQQGVNLPARP